MKGLSVNKIIIALILLASTVAFGQDANQKKSAKELGDAIQKANEDNAWAEYLKTGKTNIPYAVRREIGKEFSRGKGFRIIKGEKVQVRTSARQRRALKLQGGRK